MDTAVFELQGFIRNISRYDKDIPSLVPDGFFGEETTESVTVFQRKHLLEQTGRVDFATWNKLLEENDKSVFAFSEPVQTAPAQTEDFPLKKDKESHLNGNVNIMLSRLAEFYSNFEGAVLSPDYTEKTERFIGIFQDITDIPQTGEVDKNTWNLLSYLYLLLTDNEEK